MKLVLCLSLFFIGPVLLAGEGAFVLDHKVTNIKGAEVDLNSYKGKVLLIVNVASKCGLTPQYTELVDLHAKYAEKGLTILGFPANDFMGQEPGTDEEILNFCVKEYNVAFDMFSKITVKGDDMAPLYKQLTSAEDNGAFGGPIKWNFTKFLVGTDGKVIGRFGPRTKPDAPEVISAIEAAI